MYTYTTHELNQLLILYKNVINEPTNRHTMMIHSFIHWLKEEDRTKLLKSNN